MMLISGIVISCRHGFFQFRQLGKSIAVSLFPKKSKKNGNNEITAFQALATALGGSIGTANIAGVACAIIMGGPGSILFMWAAAIIGMGVKYAEIVLALKYRKRDKDGYCGGAMFYIEKGLTKRGGILSCIAHPLAVIFAVACMLSSLIGTTAVQSNTIALSAFDAANELFAINTDGMIRLISGVITAFLVGIVIIGGNQRIAKASEILVPVLAAVYIGICLICIISFRQNIIPAFERIFAGAFGLKQAAGGFAGYGIIRAFRIGTAKGVYSNEAGIGSAPMAHAMTSNNDPVKQGMCGIFEVFADTIVMCTMTALVILTSSVEIPYGDAGYSGTKLALDAFSTVLPRRFASIFLFISLFLFAYTSIIAWAMYGLQSAKYLFGSKVRLPFCIIYTFFNISGAVMSIDKAWLAGETMNYLMAVPNLLALLLLSGEIKKITRTYMQLKR